MTVRDSFFALLREHGPVTLFSIFTPSLLEIF
jgi:hypothetical protein